MSALNHPRPLRRSARELAEPDAIEEILQSAKLLFLALADQPAPYVLPVCFGFAHGVLYVHSARKGTKIDLLRANPSVGFSASTDMTIVPGSAACDFTCGGRSVVGTGTARILADEEERIRGMDAIMRHYSDAPGDRVYAPGSLARTCVIAIRIDTLCGKRIG
jgi:nitroimidazol reductase NimA-like FMN-containing flavoprotein (pyridoxamine 5'-phosphate oxidase superfamily)